MAIVGRPCPAAERPDSSASACQCAAIGANSAGSLSSASIRWRSSGSSRTSTGSTSSHNDSTCPAAKRSTSTPSIAHRTLHLQANHPVLGGRNRSQRRRLFPGQVASGNRVSEKRSSGRWRCAGSEYWEEGTVADTLSQGLAYVGRDEHV